jgi:SAM-dependent methyltransferase
MTAEQAIRAVFRKVLRRGHSPPAIEPLMYRVHLFDELLSGIQANAFQGKRILEIGPKDGLDSKRLASLLPSELVMIDLPEKRDQVVSWLAEISCCHRYMEANLMYLSPEQYESLGQFDLIWCTGVLYHNAEQLRFLRRLYRLLNGGGSLVLESATLRGPKSLRDGCYVEIHYPKTYRDTGTTTHLPTAMAIRAWLQMVGFQEMRDSSCFDKENSDLVGQRYACICRKAEADDSDTYYGKSGLNPPYRFGDAT